MFGGDEDRRPALFRSLAPHALGARCGAAIKPAQPSTPPCRPVNGQRLFLSTAVRLCPHPDKAGYGGEDAFFVSTLGGGALGVSDGVGGWKKRGVNPANYSRLLMHNCCCHLEKRWSSFLQTPITKWGSYSGSVLEAIKQRQLCPPVAAMMAAHTATQVPGSATVCVMELEPTAGVLTAANLGDSGFVVLRQGEVVLHSTVLQHHFDCPMQLGHPAFSTMTDWADNADVYEVQLQAGDVIITGTDGLWDNVYLDELLPLLPSEGLEVQKSADAIARLAAEHARDATFKSPYCQDMTLNDGQQQSWWSRAVKYCVRSVQRKQRPAAGGKLDDVTVVVSFVDSQPADNSSRSRRPLQLQALLDSPHVGDLKDSFTAGQRQLPGAEAGTPGVSDEHWKIPICRVADEAATTSSSDHKHEDDMLRCAD